MSAAAEARPRGRPPGTTESIESLARKSAQLDLKMIERNREGIRRDMEKISARLEDMDAANEAFIQLSEYRLALHKALMQTASLGARLAAADPQKAADGEVDASTKEILAQLRGDGI